MAAANQVLYAGLLSGGKASGEQEGGEGRRTLFIIKLIIRSIRARLEGRRAFFRGALAPARLRSLSCAKPTKCGKVKKALSTDADVCIHPRTFCLLPISVLVAPRLLTVSKDQALNAPFHWPYPVNVWPRGKEILREPRIRVIGHR